MNDILKNDGPVRTDLHCTHCSKNFIAMLDYSLDGNHVIECPYCGHEHCRVIKNGMVTDDRFDHRQQRVDVEGRNVWKHDVLPVQTSVASMFIRDRWLNRSDL